MLSREVMGVLALAILWVNTLLVFGAMAKELAKVRRMRRRLTPLEPGERGVGMIEGNVVSGDGPSNELASYSVDQVGRQAANDADQRAIAFTDRSYESRAYRGSISPRSNTNALIIVAADDSTVITAPEPRRLITAPEPRRLITAPEPRRLITAPEPPRLADVWLDRAAVDRAAACPSTNAFERAYVDARKARGFSRTVHAEIKAGTPIWIAGELTRDETTGDELLRPSAEGLLIATADPRSACARSTALLAASMLGVLVTAAVCTFVALWKPYFETVSVVGGAASLAFFLLVQPFGTAIRDMVLPPSRRPLLGSWLAHEPAMGASNASNVSARPTESEAGLEPPH